MQIFTNWYSPATTWPELIDRYAEYLQKPRWRGKTTNADGTATADSLTPQQAGRVRERLLALVRSLLQSGTLTATANPADIRIVLKEVGYSGRRFDRCPKSVWHLWRAVVFNRDRYTCVHCGRATWEVQAEQGRGLRFELDHKTPRARLGDACDDFDAANIITACRSCNVLKGQMAADRFEAELESLAKAVLRKKAAQ
jgi:hypothetical protein